MPLSRFRALQTSLKRQFFRSWRPLHLLPRASCSQALKLVISLICFSALGKQKMRRCKGFFGRCKTLSSVEVKRGEIYNRSHSEAFYSIYTPARTQSLRFGSENLPASN